MSISIPQIPSTWPRWSWTASNGQATGPQTEAALRALVSGAGTTQFHHSVWNDIVDSLKAVLDEISVSWDDTYTSYADARIDATDLHLTAAKFNSVALNIIGLFNNWWPWEYNPLSPIYPEFAQGGHRGYTGRAAFRGVSGVIDPELADNVYGWYIYELTRALNVMIDMLADDAERAELARSALDSIIGILDMEADHVCALARTALYAINRNLELNADPARALSRIKLYEILQSLSMCADPARALSRIKLYEILQSLSMCADPARVLSRKSEYVTVGALRLLVARVRTLARYAVIGSPSDRLALNADGVRGLNSVGTASVHTLDLLKLLSDPVIGLGAGRDYLPGETLSINLALIPPAMLSTGARGTSEEDIALSSDGSETLVVSGQSVITRSISLSVNRVISMWYWPVQTGNDLYVKQTYYIQQTGDNLYLGRVNSGG